MSNLAHIFKHDERVKIVDVTPKIASDLLKSSNFGNRKHRPSVVKKYANMMTNGDWKFSPETISISKTGRLLNGQHRMMAVVLSGITCRFLFATGFDDDVFSVLDRGATRTVADALSIPKDLAESASLLVRLRNKSQSSVIDADVNRAASIIQEDHERLLSFCNSKMKVFSSAPFRLAAVARMMDGGNIGYILRLYRNLVLAKTEMLPPIGHAAIRAVITGRLYAGGAHAQFINSSVAWGVFDESAMSKSKISVSFNADRALEIVRATGYGKA